jgi:surface antigen
MKLFRAIILLSSALLLQNCASTKFETVKETQGAIQEMPKISMLGEKELWTMPGMLWNGVQYMRFNLNRQEKNLHQSAVYHALNDAEIGAITSWYSKDRKASGKVRVVHQFPTSDGYCRTYQSYITLNGARRHMTNNACKRTYGEWVFLK